MRKLMHLPVLLFFVGISATASAETITTGTLVNDMVDMFRIADFPLPYYKTIQFSSYDHRSTLPDGEHWFDNSDGFGREPEPNFESIIKATDSDGIGEYLLCDVEGPGAVVRVWTAAIQGTIRMYLDDSQEPVIDVPADDFLRRPYSCFPTADSLVTTARPTAVLLRITAGILSTAFRSNTA